MLKKLFKRRQQVEKAPVPKPIRFKVKKEFYATLPNGQYQRYVPGAATSKKMTAAKSFYGGDS